MKSLSYPELIDISLEKKGFSGDTLLYSAITAKNAQAVVILFNQTYKPNPCAIVTKSDKTIGMPISDAIVDLICTNNAETSKKLTLQFMIMLMIRNMKSVAEIIDPASQQNILHLLCEIGDEEIALKLAQEIFKKVTPQEKMLLFSQRNTSTNPPNIFAVQWGRLRLLELFLTESDDQAKSSLLQFSAQQKNIETLKIILKFVDINNQSPRVAQTALHVAAYEGLPTVVDFLLTQGADPNIINNQRITPSEIAKARGHFNIAKMLQEKMGVFSEEKISSTLLWYISRGNLEETKRIVTKENINVCFPKEETTALYFACDKNQIEIARFLIAFGADVNQETKFGFPLFTAACNGKTQLVQLLLSVSNINVNLTYEGFTALHAATQNGYSEIVRLLLEKGANPWVKKQADLEETALIIATIKKATACIDVLLEFRPETHIDQTDTLHQTALHIALKGQDIPSVTALCRKKPNVEIKNSNGITPFVAAIKTSSKIVNLLLPHVTDYKAHCWDVSSKKLYPLHFSILCFDYSFSRKLILKFPECITIASIIGAKEYLPIELAILFKNYPAIRLLLQHGAKLTNALGQQMRETEDVEFNKILEEYSTENVTKAKSVTPTVPLQEKISTRSYLASLGFDDKEIEAMRKSNQEKFAKKINFWNAPSKTEKPKSYTWFNKNLKSDDIKSIESAIKCFYKLDTDALRQQKCPEDIITLFENQLPKFSPHHLKKIDLDMTFQLETSDTPVEVKPTHELWVPGITDRVLIFQVPSDDKSASLYYGCLYLPNGLHETTDMKSLLAQSKSININMDQKKLIPSNSTA